jgi:hypothetical protein
VGKSASYWLTSLRGRMVLRSVQDSKMGKSNTSTLDRNKSSSSTEEQLSSVRGQIRAINEKLKALGCSEEETISRLNCVQEFKGAFEEECRLTRSPPASGTDGVDQFTERRIPTDAGQGGRPLKLMTRFAAGIRTSLNYGLDRSVAFYKRIINFLIFRPRKLSKSNFFGVFFSVLAFIFYFELHTTPGFTRMWLKWENVDLRSVEVCNNNKEKSYFHLVFLSFWGIVGT